MVENTPSLAVVRMKRKIGFEQEDKEKYAGAKKVHRSVDRDRDEGMGNEV